MCKKILPIICLLFLNFLCYGIVLPEGTDARLSDISFENDKIKSVVLSTTTEINTPLGKIKAFGTVTFTENGTVEEITPNENGTFETPIGNLVYKQFETIKFYDSGALAAITLAEPAVLTVNNETYKIMPGYFFLYDEWNPFGFELQEDKNIRFEFGDVIIPKESIIMFYNNGNILSFSVNQPTKIETAAGNLMAEGAIALWSPNQPMFIDVKSTDGLDTKYGKVYPVPGTKVSFSTEGIITEVTPQDIMICSLDDYSFMTQSRETLNFYDDGNLKSGVLKNSKMKFKNWSIDFYGENNRFVIYDENKLYIPYGLVSEINDLDFSKKTMRFLFTEDKYYFWTTEPDGYPSATNIRVVTKSTPLTSELFKSIRGCTISHFSKDSNDININNSPLIFNEDGKVIGYRKAEFGTQTFNSYWDTWETKSYYDKYRDEYVNYTEDVMFK